jgi:hypothetical protein
MTSVRFDADAIIHRVPEPLLACSRDIADESRRSRPDMFLVAFIKKAEASGPLRPDRCEHYGIRVLPVIHPQESICLADCSEVGDPHLTVPLPLRLAACLFLAQCLSRVDPCNPQGGHCCCEKAYSRERQHDDQDGRYVVNVHAVKNAAHGAKRASTEDQS